MSELDFEAGIVVEVARHGFDAIAEEMAISHVRAAYSSVVRDMLDFSTAVCDGEGQVIAQGLSLALQLGAVPRLMTQVMQLVPRFDPGDIYLVNHPWKGGVHLPDFFFIKPVFMGDGDRPVAFMVIVSHMVDVGGRFPGSVSLVASSLWEEGLVLPPIALVKRGTSNEAVFDIIAANSRHPDTVLGDIRAAQVGLETGAGQFTALAARLGPDELLRAMGSLLASTERATRSAISELPDGKASASEGLDHAPDVHQDRICCEVTKSGDRLTYDFTGTSPQLATGNNCGLSDIVSVVAFVTRAALGTEIAVNEGFYRCIDIVAPEGTVITALYPAAVGARGSTVYRLADVAMAAMGKLVPSRLPATSAGAGVLFFAGTTDAGKPWIFLDLAMAGWGGTARADGVAGASPPIMNAATIPIEVIEQSVPLRITDYGLLPDTGGLGRYRGAPGIIREYEILTDGTTINSRVERAVHASPGTDGGSPGTAARARVKRNGGAWEAIAPIATFVLNKGDRFQIHLAGGGGFGNPDDRSAAAIERDLIDGLVSRGTERHLVDLEQA